jgi:hypothetical protein
LPVPVHEWPLRVTIVSRGEAGDDPAAPFASWLRGRLIACRAAPTAVSA